jgi:allantoicase
MIQSNQLTYTKQKDLVAERLVSKASNCTNDFLMKEDNLLKPVRGIFMADKNTEQVKWMLSWLNPAKRKPCHYKYAIKLAMKSKCAVVDTDTNRFSASSADSCLKEGIDIIIEQEEDKLNEKIEWKNNLSQTQLHADDEQMYETEINSNDIFTKERLIIFPDGGISRMHFWGNIVK